MQRLSGGIDSIFSTDEKLYQVKRGAFTIQYRKVNVANINQKKNLKFEIDSPGEEVMGDKQKTTVIFPHDPKIQYGHNVLTAVMFSKDTGESFANWKAHKDDDY